MREDFLNDELFGNEAGEDEDKERLSSYYLEKPENDVFFSPQRPLAFVRARKGVGKSALLNYAAYKLERKILKPYIFRLKHPTLSQLNHIQTLVPVLSLLQTTGKSAYAQELQLKSGEI